jgi:hypothetical protein
MRTEIRIKVKTRTDERNEIVEETIYGRGYTEKLIIRIVSHCVRYDPVERVERRTALPSNT